MVTTNPLQPRGGLLDMMGQGDSGFAGWLNPRRNTLMQFGQGMIGADSTRGAMRGAAQGLSQGSQQDTAYALLQQEQAEKQRTLQEQAEQRNATLQFLQQSHPDLAQAVSAGLPITQAWSEAFQRQRSGAGGDENFFGNAVPFQNEDGSIGFGQMGNRGTFKPVQLPEGASPAPTTRQIDIGTHIVTQDVYGNELFRTPKNNEQAAYDSAFGSESGKAAAARIMELPKTIAQADNMLGTIDGILNDPALDYSTGWLAWMQNAPGTEQYRFGQRALQLQGQSFLQAFESLKGGGQITEIEGQKATQAIGRLSTAQSPQDYRDALNELKGIINDAKQRAMSSAGVQVPLGGAANDPLELR